MRCVVLLSAVIACRSDTEKFPIDPVDDGIIETVDADGDGFFSDEDCDDSNAQVNPGVDEVCDGVDNNCNGDVDEGVLEAYFQDGDADGYGDPESVVVACDSPEGFVPFSSDCDDTDTTVYPSAEELCDGVDNDCNGEIDEGVGELVYLDRDVDGYGDDEESTLMCDLIEGYASIGGDCDDRNTTVYPSAEEVCDGIDNDCNTQIDEGVTNLYYQDDDGDGYGNPQVTLESCERPVGTVENSYDCDDTDDTISPSNFEECGDGIDNNCDGNFDEDGALGSTAWYFDGDLDGYGSGVAVLACVGSVDYVSNNADCDDADGLISPVASEICDGGIDNDCNGLSDDLDGGVINGSVWYLDYDQDGEGGSQYSMTGCLPPSGYVAGSVDCDDGNASVNSTALEVCDGLDNDCDGLTDDDDTTVIYQTSDVVYSDLDGDGYGDSASLALACTPSANQSLNAEDCDDTDALVNPMALEVCDGIDNDCNTQIDEGLALGPFYTDADGDGFGDVETMYFGCPSTTSVTNGEDCDDGDSSVVQCEDCSMILSSGLSTGDGIYEVDPAQLSDPFEVYCDMTTEGGGWTLTGRQVPSEQFTITDQDINLASGLDPSFTFRYGNDKIQRFSPTVAWRIVSTDSNDAVYDYTWFKPACVVDWFQLVGSYGSNNLPLDTDCGIAYTNSNFNRLVSAYTQGNCSYGIGQNNSGQYCSIRMGSCAWQSVQDGGAAPCNVGQVTSFTVSLWMK